MRWLTNFFPADWYQDVTVKRRGGGLDRFGRKLSTTTFEVEGCLLNPKSAAEEDRHGQWSDTDGTISHHSFVFEQNDLVEIPEGQRNAGTWEVQAPAFETTFGNQATVRRVNSREIRETH